MIPGEVLNNMIQLQVFKCGAPVAHGEPDSMGQRSMLVRVMQDGASEPSSTHAQEILTFEDAPPVASRVEPVKSARRSTVWKRLRARWSRTSEGPVLRATLESGEAWDDPSEDHLFMLLEEVERDGQAFLIVDRLSDRSGNTYVQTQKDQRGLYLVERREGSAEEHWVSGAVDMRAAHSIVAAWAFGTGGEGGTSDWSKAAF